VGRYLLCYEIVAARVISTGCSVITQLLFDIMFCYQIFRSSLFSSVASCT